MIRSLTLSLSEYVSLFSSSALLPLVILLLIAIGGNILLFVYKGKWTREKQKLLDEIVKNRDWKDNLQKLEDSLHWAELAEESLIQIVVTLKSISGAHRAAIFLFDLQKEYIYAIGEKEDLDVYADAKTLHKSEGRLYRIIDDLQPQVYDFLNPSTEDLTTNRCVIAQKVFDDGNLSGFDAPIYFRQEVFGKISLMFDRYVEWTDGKVDFYMSCGQLIGKHISNISWLDTFRQSAILRERKYLSRELHDNLSQLVSALNMQVEAAWLSYEKGGHDELGIVLSRMMTTSKIIQSDLREEMLGLRDDIEKSGNLVQSIGACVERFQQGSDIAIILDDQCPSDSVIASIGVVSQLTRILHEGLSNVCRHSKATQVIIRIAEFNQKLSLDIEDNGQGFDVNGVKEGHLGLQIIRERAQEIGAQIFIRSTRDIGTCIRVELPKSHFLYDFSSTKPFEVQTIASAFEKDHNC